MFGNWTKTKECSDSCFLKIKRHCELVPLPEVPGAPRPDVDPPSCDEQNVTMIGSTPCTCKGEELHCISLAFSLTYISHQRS